MVNATAPTFHHVGLTVADIGRSCRFYAEVVGMTLWDQDKELNVAAPENRRSEAAAAGLDLMSLRSDSFDKLTNNPGAEIKYVNLRSADGALIYQLIEYVDGGGAALEPDHHKAGSLHLSFFVDDVDAKRAEVERRGDVPIASEIVQITPSMRSFYVTDPDGIPVEFIEIGK
jgi:catechol 2,3-dioxygenase-like lactoylglutathione lyase family enzyme